MLLSLLVYLLSSNAVTLKKNQSILFSRFVLISLVFVAISSYNELYIEPLSSANGVGLYGGLFNITTFSLSFNIFILIITSLILGLTSYYSRKVIIKEYSSIYHILFSKLSYNKFIIANKAGEQFRIIEYALIIVFVITGAIFLISTADLVSIFLSIELQSYGLYILSTIYRNSESATRNGLTYFLLGGMSSCFILLGSALLYANAGTTSLDNIYIIISITEIKEYYDASYNMMFYQPYYFHTALIILCVGLLFKVSAAPFHFWSPDVYDGIPTIVTTFVAIIAKISIFAFLLELVYYTGYFFFNFSWKLILIMSSVLSLIIGSILGLTQFRIKRLFAYSTISHVGFILLSLAVNSTESIQSYIFYILQYSISNLNAFIILISIGYTFYFNLNKVEGERNLSNVNGISKPDLIDQNNSPVQLISQIRGYFYINPYIALSLAITLFSFVGIPPLIGFFAKQMVLSAALDSGYYFVTFIAILTSVIGAGYYLNLIKEIFFYKNNSEINYLKEVKLNAYLKKNTLFSNIFSSSNNKVTEVVIKRVSFYIKDITINSFLSTIMSLLTLLLLLFIYMPDPWLNIVSILSLMLFKS